MSAQHAQKSIEQIFGWISDKTKRKRPDARLRIYNAKNDRSVHITKSSWVYEDGTLLFPIGAIFDADNCPKTCQELRESLTIIVDFESKKTTYTRDLSEANIYQKGTIQCVGGHVFAQGDIIWMYGGMCVQIMKNKGKPCAAFMLLADAFSVTEKVRRSLQDSAHAQQKLEKIKREAKSHRRYKRQKAKQALEQAKEHEEAVLKAKHALWSECVKHICAVADDVTPSQVIVHAGTVLKKAPRLALDFERFGEIYKDPDFRRLELTKVHDAFQLTPTPVPASSIPAPIEAQSTGSDGSKQPRDDLQRQILLLQQEIYRLRNEQLDMDQLPPPYPM